MPAVVQARARAIGKESILPVGLRKQLLHQPAHEDHRQHPLPRLVRAEHVDHVAAPVLQAHGLQPQDRFHGAPEAFERHLMPRVQRLGRFVQRLVEQVQGRRLAAPNLPIAAGAGLRIGLRRAEQVPQEPQPRRPVLGREREQPPLFDFAQRIQLVRQRLRSRPFAPAPSALPARRPASARGPRNPSGRGRWNRRSGAPGAAPPASRP